MVLILVYLNVEIVYIVIIYFQGINVVMIVFFGF